MINDPVLDSKVDSLAQKRRKLVEEKKALEASIKGLGITKNAAYHSAHKINPEVIALRDAWVKRKIKVDSALTEIRSQIRDIHRKKEVDKNVSVAKILREIFSDEQMAEIGEEAKKRLQIGYEPQKMSFSIAECMSVKEKMYEYRKLAQEQMEKMIQFRLELTGLIQKGCEQFGDAEFLKFISPLNQLIIPVNELRKIKLKHHL